MTVRGTDTDSDNVNLANETNEIQGPTDEFYKEKNYDEPLLFFLNDCMSTQVVLMNEQHSVSRKIMTFLFTLRIIYFIFMLHIMHIKLDSCCPANVYYRKRSPETKEYL